MSTISTSTTITDPTSYTWPITINGGTVSSPVIITFGTNLTLSSVSQFFIIGSQYITIEGNNKILTINVSSYPGLVRNGTSTVSGFSNINVQNFSISSTGSLSSGNGWVAQSYFGNTSTSVVLSNLSSNGAISASNAGGIVGQFCGNSGSVTITNCFSTGVISSSGTGGICGRNAGNQGQIILTKCYSSGAISGITSGGVGGICGSNFAFGATLPCYITNCYSTGNITSRDAGGIVGSNLGANSTGTGTPNITISNCYSLTPIGALPATKGTIIGPNLSGTYVNNPVITLNNCYTQFSPLVSANYTKSVTTNNCFAQNGGPWADSNASIYLTGTPTYSSGTLINPIGSVWADIDPTVSSTPYVFSSFGFSPYTTTLTQTYSQTIKQTESTNPALAPSGHTYSIVSINNQVPSTFPSITITSSDSTLGGTLNTTMGTPVGTYTIVVMQQSDYSLTNFVMTLNAVCFVEGTRILCLVGSSEQYCPIENLVPGNLVKTVSNGYKPIKIIGYNHMQNNPKFKSESIYSCGNLCLTGSHSLLVKYKKSDRNKYTKGLVDGMCRIMASKDSRFTQVIDNKVYKIYNFVIDDQVQHGIYAKGPDNLTNVSDTLDGEIITESITERCFKRGKMISLYNNEDSYFI
jgi:hypothetical protein